ncbi:MAG: YIP1 family protein, partial [Methanosarcinales archaeon]|nr:YIP1 family protein [Methanosarcinales archaeon]
GMSSRTPHAATLCKGHREGAHGFDILVDSLEICISLQAQVCKFKGKKEYDNFKLDKQQYILMNIDLKEKTARYLLFAITISISISIIVYSFFTGTLLWGIIAAVLIIILTLVLSEFIISQLKMVNFIEKVKGFLIEPSKTYDASKEDTLGDATKYFVILMMIFAILNVISSHGFFSFGIRTSLFLLVLSPIIRVVSVFIYGAILHISIYIVGGRNGISQTIKALMYAYTPALLFSVMVFYISGILVWVLWLWALVLLILGIRQLQEITTNRALIAVLAWIVLLSLLWMLVQGNDFIYSSVSAYANKVIN